MGGLAPAAGGGEDGVAGGVPRALVVDDVDEGFVAGGERGVPGGEGEGEFFDCDGVGGVVCGGVAFAGFGGHVVSVRCVGCGVRGVYVMVM